MRIAWIALTASFALLPACADPSGPLSRQAKKADRYEAWLDEGHRSDVAAYRAHLERERLADTVPMDALLRTSRRWRICLHDEYATPPPGLWSNMGPTLRLISRLREAGLIDTSLARSVYRDRHANRCAGGAVGSKHLRNNAIDFDLPLRPENVKALCEWWRTHGAKAKMGLGFYTPTAIHIDTSGFRTWGNDRTRRTSLCVARR